MKSQHHIYKLKTIINYIKIKIESIVHGIKNNCIAVLEKKLDMKPC